MYRYTKKNNNIFNCIKIWICTSNQNLFISTSENFISLKYMKRIIFKLIILVNETYILIHKSINLFLI